MKNYRVIFETDDKQFRILEHPDLDYDYENLAGDCFNPKVNPEISVDKIKKEENEFKSLIENEGVFGYVLERWNSAPGCGYEHVDSCWGFIGQYSESEQLFTHYIVEEMKRTACQST